MPRKTPSSEVLGKISRRERQIMEIVYAANGATSKEVHERMTDAPSYSAVRAQMRVLVEKGVLKHRRVGLKYVFEPTVSLADAREPALTRLVRSLFENSAVSVVATLLNSKELNVTPTELADLQRLIAEKQTKSNGKK